MDTKEIITNVIKDYILKIAYKKSKLEDKIRLCLYLKSEKEVGIYILEDFDVAEDVITLKNMLGIWAMTYGIINGFISKSFQEYAKELDCSLQAINCMIWLNPEKETGIELCLYNEHIGIKEITLNELLT